MTDLSQCGLLLRIMARCGKGLLYVIKIGRFAELVVHAAIKNVLFAFRLHMCGESNSATVLAVLLILPGRLGRVASNQPLLVHHNPYKSHQNSGFCTRCQASWPSLANFALYFSLPNFYVPSEWQKTIGQIHPTAPLN